MRTLSNVFIACLFGLLVSQGCAGSTGGASEAPDSDIAVPQDTPSSDSLDGSQVEPQEAQVLIVTTLGELVIEVNTGAAPVTAANFLSYVDQGFYDGQDGMGATIFHRVIADFMVQGGGFTDDLPVGTKKSTQNPIAHESPNGLLNLRGTVAMARTTDPNSATSQFFVNHIDNPFLDYVSASEPGYVVFGEVISGMDTIDTIAAVPTDGNDTPLSPVVLESVGRVSN